MGVRFSRTKTVMAIKRMTPTMNMLPAISPSPRSRSSHRRRFPRRFHCARGLGPPAGSPLAPVVPLHEQGARDEDRRVGSRDHADNQTEGEVAYGHAPQKVDG